jgi:hypothetical protein
MYTDPAVLAKGNVWTTGTTYELEISRNGQPVTGFSGPLVYRFR